MATGYNYSQISVLVNEATQFKKGDLYVKLEVGDQKEKTKTLKNTKAGAEAKWNEKKVLNARPTDTLKVTLMEDDLIGDDVFGVGQLHLSQVINGSPPQYNDWVILNQDKKGKTLSGEPPMVWLTIDPVNPTPVQAQPQAPAAAPVNHQQQPHGFQVIVREARHICDNDYIRNSPVDAYCRLRLNGKPIGETKVLYRTTHPMWNQAFTVPPTPGTLELSVWDAGMEYHIGGHDLDMREIMSTSKKDEWYFIKDKLGDDVGQILLSYDNGMARPGHHQGQMAPFGNGVGFPQFNPQHNHHHHHHHSPTHAHGHFPHSPMGQHSPIGHHSPMVHGHSSPTYANHAGHAAGTLRLIVVHGEGFDHHERFEDIYVVLKGKGFFKRTGLSAAEGVPIWNEEFFFEPGLQSQVEVVVYEEGIRHDKMVGSSMIDLREMAAQETDPWVVVYDQFSNPSGSLRLSISDALREPPMVELPPSDMVFTPANYDTHVMGMGPPVAHLPPHPAHSRPRLNPHTHHGSPYIASPGYAEPIVVGPEPTYLNGGY